MRALQLRLQLGTCWQLTYHDAPKIHPHRQSRSVRNRWERRKQLPSGLETPDPRACGWKADLGEP
eukprot:10728452-Alexandrium_andersonii.AAC.1